MSISDLRFDVDCLSKVCTNTYTYKYSDVDVYVTEYDFFHDDYTSLDVEKRRKIAFFLMINRYQKYLQFQ